MDYKFDENNHDNIIIKCVACLLERSISYNGYKRSIKNQLAAGLVGYRCRSCVFKTNEYKAKFLGKKRTIEQKETLSKSIKESWVNSRESRMQQFSSDVFLKRVQSQMIENNKKWKKDPVINEKMRIARANHPRVSSIQNQFYSILDDLNIKYFREYNDKPSDKECSIGPWTFDCVIPRDGQRTLLVDINGNWIHSQPSIVVRDAQKLSYIVNNFSDKYECRAIWEHDLSCYNKIIETVKYWMGITKIELVDFNFSDIAIKEPLADDYRLLLSKYHYLPNAGRGGVVYGAFINDALIAVCVFSKLSRQNIHKSVGEYNFNELVELSRFCVHPRFQKKNLGSWFISRCLKLFKARNNGVKAVISYCDTTFNHNGALYKSLGFMCDKIVKPDYWYTNSYGDVMHKKTLYNKAVKMGTTENEFAAQFNYTKVIGKEKLRFIFKY